MGSAITSFQSIVGAQGAGTADIDKMVAAFSGLEGAIDRAAKKGHELNEHKGWGEFAEKVKEGIENPLKAIGGAAQDLLTSLGPVGTGVAAFGAVLGTATFAAFEAAKSLGEYGTQVQNTALRTGLAVKEVGQFSYAARAAGGDVTQFERAMRKLSEGLQDGSEDGKKARKALGDLGVEARDSVTGSMRPMSDIFVQISTGLRGIEDPAKRNAEAVRLFGRAGIELLPTMIGLTENFAKAKELGLGASDADIKRWEEYHHQMLGLEVAFERLARKVKEPLAAVISFALKDKGGKEYSLAELEARGVNVERFKPRTAYQQNLDAQNAGVDTSHAQNWMGQGILRGVAAATDAIEQRRLADAAVAAYEARQQADLQYQLQQAEEQLKGLVAPTKGVSSVADVKAFSDAQHLVESIKKRIEANKELEQQQKHLDGEVNAFHVRALESELSAGEKILRQRDDLIAQARQLGRSEEFIAGIRSDASKALDVMLQKSMAEFTRWDLGGSPQTQSSAERAKAMFGENGALNPLAGLAEKLKAYESSANADSRIEDITLASRRSEIGARAGRADRMQQLLLGPGHEAEAIVAGYQIRLGLAQRLYDLDVARAQQSEDADKQRIEMAKAEADLRKETYEAEIERELKIAELQRQRIDQWRSFVVGALHGIESGDLSGFLKQQASGLLDRVAGNAAEMGWKSVSGMIPHASEGSFMGKLLAGSQFGPDPMKTAGVRLETAGDRLTMAAADLTGAARAMATSSTGGGGGLVRLASGAVAQAGAPGYLPIGVEGVPEGHGLPTDLYGQNGDWAGETAHPAGAFNWGRAAGIGGAAAGGFFGLYSGIQSGGGRGALTAAGSTLAAAGSIMALASKALSWAGPAGMIAGMGLGFLAPALFGDPRKERAEQQERERMARTYRAPAGNDYMVDVDGRPVDYDARGGPRVVNNVTINAMDPQSFGDVMRRNAGEVMNVVAGAVGSGDGEELVGHLQQRVGL